MTSSRLSLQLYTFRDALAADAPAALARIAEMGFTAVEAFGFVGRAAELRSELDAAGLVSPSGHASFLSEKLEPGAETVSLPPIEHVLDEAAALGVEILIDPYLPREAWLAADDIRRTADLLNSYVDLAVQRGIRLGYHNHSHEFHADFDGASGFELLAAHLDPRVVLEVDVYWAAIAGQDVAALLRRLGGQVRLLHAKDGYLTPDPHHPDTAGAPLDQRIAGTGEVDIAGYLNAAPDAEYTIVEFDSFDGDLFDAADKSAAYLQSLGVRA